MCGFTPRTRRKKGTRVVKATPPNAREGQGALTGTAKASEFEKVDITAAAKSLDVPTEAEIDVAVGFWKKSVEGGRLEPASKTASKEIGVAILNVRVDNT